MLWVKELAKILMNIFNYLGDNWNPASERLLFFWSWRVRVIILLLATSLIVGSGQVFSINWDKDLIGIFHNLHNYNLAKVILLIIEYVDKIFLGLSILTLISYVLYGVVMGIQDNRYRAKIYKTEHIQINWRGFYKWKSYLKTISIESISWYGIMYIYIISSNSSNTNGIVLPTWQIVALFASALYNTISILWVFPGVFSPEKHTIYVCNEKNILCKFRETEILTNICVLCESYQPHDGAKALNKGFGRGGMHTCVHCSEEQIGDYD